MLEKETVYEGIIKNLSMCNIKRENEYLEIELPVVLFFNQQLITLRFYACDEGYYISTTDTVFDEYPEYSENYCEQYYDLFMKNDSHEHYDIQREGAYLYKKYDVDRSARTAVDEFVKFFIHLDEYILDYWKKENK